VVLAAGEGQRLRPLTGLRPKALCPVGNVPLLDRALARVASLGFAGPERVAVNASYLAGQVVAHAGDRVHISVEPGRPLGTAGALGKLRGWIDGRGVLVANSDAHLSPDEPDELAGLAGLLAGWDGRSVRLLGVPTTPDDRNRFDGHRFAGLSLLPWHRVKELPAEPAELVRPVWRAAEAAGELEVTPYRGLYLDTGTPADYLAANLDVAGSENLVDPGATVTGRCLRSVVGAGAVVEGDLTRSVVWPGARVAAGEHLVDAIRAGAGRTVTMSGC
jgi:N-acetyl-alpha-D-muramate 1-phosphate uridylyltransferase